MQIWREKWNGPALYFHHKLYWFTCKQAHRCSQKYRHHSPPSSEVSREVSGHQDNPEQQIAPDPAAEQPANLRQSIELHSEEQVKSFSGGRQRYEQVRI